MRKHLIPVALGVLGVVLALSAWHLYLDHRNHHAAIQFILDVQQNAARQQGQK